MCLGSARDILLAGAPPRAVFVDYPLGHSVGQPFNRDDQHALVSEALSAFGTLGRGDGLLTLANQWPDEGWQATAMNPAAGDTRAQRDTTPQWQCEADRVLAERIAAG